MPSVTITLTDTDEDTVSCHSSFVPAAGQRLSPAQMAGLDIVIRTTKQWGIKRLLTATTQKQPLIDTKAST